METGYGEREKKGKRPKWQSTRAGKIIGRLDLDKWEFDTMSGGHHPRSVKKVVGIINEESPPRKEIAGRHVIYGRGKCGYALL